MTMIAVQVLLVQLDVAWEQREANHERVRAALRVHEPEPNDLVVLPEMFATGFSMNIATTHDADRLTERFLSSVAAEYECYIVAGVTQRPDDAARARNCALVLHPLGQTMANYCKIHPFSLGNEHRHFEAGDQIVTFETGEFTVAPFVCYDLRFPEIFRAAVRRGANLFTVIANWPDTRIEHWVTLLRARAIENQAYVVGVNRVGSDPTLRYPGRSLVVDPMGNVALDAGDRGGVFYADVSIEAVRSTRKRLPFLRDMREL